MKKLAFLLLTGIAASVAYADETPLTGDVNGDGVVTAADALDECRYIIQLNPSPFDATLADVNGDGKVNVLDATDIVAIYTPEDTDEETGGETAAPRRETADYNLTLSNVIAEAGETSTLVISMNNPANSVVSFQMELVLPEGVYVDGDPTLTSRAPNTHDVMGNMIGTDRYMLICVSTSLKTFTGTSGALIEVPLKISELKADGLYTTHLENVELVTRSRTDVYIPDRMGYLVVGENIWTDVVPVTADSTPTRNYNLAGLPVTTDYRGPVIEVKDDHKALRKYLNP